MGFNSGFKGLKYVYPRRSRPLLASQGV